VGASGLKSCFGFGGTADGDYGQEVDVDIEGIIGREVWDSRLA
jgi:hypothetical protein